MRIDQDDMTVVTDQYPRLKRSSAGGMGVWFIDDRDNKEYRIYLTTSECERLIALYNDALPAE